jgi:hypothetical protein
MAKEMKISINVRVNMIKLRGGIDTKQIIGIILFGECNS